MKKLLISLLSCSMLLTIACSKSNSGNSSLSSTSEATVSNDNKSGGIYKGVLVGSSGTVKIILQGGTVSAEVTIDGITKILPATNLPSGWTSGQSLTDIKFSKDNWTLSFSVSPAGSNPQIFMVSIPGHTGIEVYVIKETSTMQVKVYEGTYGKDSNASDLGAWNLVLSTTDTSFGLYKSVSNSKLAMYGSFNESDGSIRISGMEESMRAEGTLRDNSFSGIWAQRNLFGGTIPQSGGKWQAKRTL